MARGGLRAHALKARELQTSGQEGLALAWAVGLAADNPSSALALNLLGSLHRHFGSAAWNGRASDEDETASKLELHHHQLALDAFYRAAQIAPNCVLTAICHAEALAACSRVVDAELELLRVCSMPAADHVDPALHHVGFKRVSTAEKRKIDALRKAHVTIKKFEVIINNQIVPVEAATLLRGVAAVDDEVRRHAAIFLRAYPYSVRAQLLLVYVELEHARGLDLVADKRQHLRSRVLALISESAVAFDCSLLIALFRTNVLFALDEFDEAERECRRALRIKEPTDPGLDDIPPAVSVPGADYDFRVTAVKKQLRILLKRIIVVAGVCWSSIKSTQQGERVDRVISVRVNTLQGHYNGIDKPAAAEAVSDTLHFHKNHSSWSFLVCPNSSCLGTKFLGTKSLWEHMRGKHHRYVLWNKLQSVLGAVLYENPSKDDHSFDGITLCQDSNKHDIFRLPRVQPIFESLLLSPSIGIQAESLAEIRQRKCREGAEVIEDIKEKLSLLPTDEASTEYVDSCFAIQELWVKFLKSSALDHREVILPLARSFQWIQMKSLIALSANDLGRFIGGANIDTMFGKVPAAPDRNVSVVYVSKSSHASNFDNQSGENLQTENLQLLCSNETLKDGEKCEESEVHVVDSNSETMVDQRSTDSTIDVHDAATIIISMHRDTSFAFSQKRITEVELENKDRSEKSNYSYNSDGEKGSVLPLKNVPPIITHDAFVDNAQNDHSHARLVPLEGCSASDSEAVQFHRERWAAAMNALNVSSGTSGQSVKEMASTSSCQRSLNDFNKNNADKELSILSLVVRSLCNLRHFRDNFLTEPLDEGTDDDYMPEEKNDGGWKWELAEAEYYRGALEEGGPSDRDFDCKQRRLGGMQYGQPEFDYSKIDQDAAKAVRRLVVAVAQSTGYHQLTFALDASLVPVNLNLVTAANSFQQLMGRPLEQTVNGTCAIVASAKCVEVQHKREYESLYGAGTFNCNAAAPRKLRKSCRHANILSDSGAKVTAVLGMIKNMGGVRTTNERYPAPSFLPLSSWQEHNWYSGGGLSADRIAELLDTRGPFIGKIWVSPWYHLFNRALDNDLVYQSGCARNSALQAMSKANFGELVGMHSVVCFEYRMCNGHLHVLVQDNHNATTGPERWIHYAELEVVYTVSVNTLDRFHD